MEKLILKQKLSELIEGKKVVAALFYTFNFDPRFFENYIMPLLVTTKGKSFSDEEIHNKILWRQCAKENLIPPIAVYCDYYAKDVTNAPTLGYDIQCVKMPSAKGKITNFHPKQIFILLEDEGEQTLLFITGSGNITVNGWCDNFECFSFKEIKKNKTVPNRTSTNSIQDYIGMTNNLMALKNKILAEDLIQNFLKYVDVDFPFFNNFKQDFNEFLVKNIFENHKNEKIDEVEIVSPYFSNDIILLDWIKSKGVKSIKCLIPTVRKNEVQLEKEHFLNLQKSGLAWCYWNGDALNSEVRNQHSKIYRLYSEKKVYTVIGSVNFTNPAWGIYNDDNNSSNIESGILYVENYNNEAKLLRVPKDFDINKTNFISGKSELENPENVNGFNRDAPDIEFRIDWKNKKLIIDAKIKNLNCNFSELFNNEIIKNGSYAIDINPIDSKRLAKNALIKVEIIQHSVLVIYNYYANQEYIETKPLGFNLDVHTILRYWQFFDDEYSRDKITRSIAEKMTDESGIVVSSKIETKLLLNEMATHFIGLVKLENFLFPAKKLNQTEQREQFANIQYYLLSENIETLPVYLSDLARKYKDRVIQKSFYWMILQIIDKMMYAKAEKCLVKKIVDEKLWKQFIKDIKKKRKEVREISDEISNKISELKEKEKWIVEQLLTEYD